MAINQGIYYKPFLAIFQTSRVSLASTKGRRNSHIANRVGCLSAIGPNSNREEEEEEEEIVCLRHVAPLNLKNESSFRRTRTHPIDGAHSDFETL